jgi:ATP-dependent RNA helicase DDX10/DBP4
MAGKRRVAQPGKPKRSQAEADEIAALEARIAAGVPEPGTLPGGGGGPRRSATDAPADGAEAAAAAAGGASYADVRRFDELPLSRYTLDALRDAKYAAVTAIQRAALPHALAGRDVLGAAKTGSGKTLAFLLPVRSAWPRPAWRPARAVRCQRCGALAVGPERTLQQPAGRRFSIGKLLAPV